jgi:hypothetical protein
MRVEALAEALASDPIPLAVRHQRVANGSRRKRDLAAVRMADELKLLEAVGQCGAGVIDCWAEAKARLRTSVPQSTFDLWVDPLELVGAKGHRLLLSAPEDIRAWAERRYSGLIREALAGSGYTDIAIVGQSCQ